MKRLDTAPKLNGSLVYAIDVKLPGMLCAAIKDCPVFGGKLVSFDNAAIAKMPGVVRAVRVNDTTVAVVADTWWHAKKALDALPIVWDEGENATRTSAQIAEHLKEGLTAANAYAMTTVGDIRRRDCRRADQGRGGVQHAVPRARVHGADELHGEVHAGARRVLGGHAERRGVAGGAFGAIRACRSKSARSTRRSWAAGSAVAAARRTTCGRRRTSRKQFPGVPIKMIWSREEDMTHDFYRPISQARMQAGIDDVGQSDRAARPRVRPVDQRVQRRGGGQGRQGRPPAAGLLREAGRRAVRLHRAEPPHRVRDAQHARAGRTVARRQHEPERGVPRMLHRRGRARREQGSARVPARAHEQASQAPRGAQRCRRKGGLGNAAAAGVHRGIAQFMGYGSYSAAVAEVSVGAGRHGEGASHGARAQLRARGESRPDRGAGRGLGRVRPVRGAVRRADRRQGPHRRGQLPPVPDPAPRGDAQGRDGDRADVRLLGRRGRADDLRRVARSDERDPRGDGTSRCATCRCAIRWRRSRRHEVVVVRRGRSRLSVRCRRRRCAWSAMARPIASRRRAIRHADARWSSRANRPIASCVTRCPSLPCASRATSDRRSPASARA